MSLPEQEARCRAFIESKGWTLDERHVFREEGVSGAKQDRPALGALLRAVDAAEVGAVVTPKIDRLGRNARHNLELFERFDAAKAVVWSPDGRTHDDKFIRTVESAIAERERDNLSERVAAITGAKAERGSYHGGIAPYGYVKGEHGGLVVHESEAKWVRFIFRRYAHEGATMYRIAQELADADAPVKRGGQWKPNRIADRLDQPIYAGLVKFGKTGKHDALIDARTFRLAQERRQATKTLASSGRGTAASQGRGRQPAVHLLSHGLLKCACGASMAPRVDSRSGRRTYRCVTRLSKMNQGATPCIVPALPQALVDGVVLRYLANEVVSPGLTAGELEAEQERATADARKARAEAERAAREASDRLEAAEVKWLDGKLTDERYGKLRDRLEGERAAAEREGVQATATIEALSDPDPDAFAAVERLRADLDGAAADAASLGHYRQLIVKLFDSFELIQGDADAAEEVEGFPTIPTFLYKQPSPRKGTTAEHRFVLLPNLRPDLAALYGSDPLVPAPVGLIERNGLPCLYASGPL